MLCLTNKNIHTKGVMMFWLLHLIALVLFLPALFVTIPLHIIVNQQRKKSDEVSKIAAQLRETNEASKLATQLRLQWLANETKGRVNSEEQ